jgi:uncharacterized tellurite resistance protein B-like protein
MYKGGGLKGVSYLRLCGFKLILRYEMIENIKKFFSEKIDTSEQKSETYSEHAVSIATCALLLEMAHADNEFGDDERDHIISVLKSSYGISENDAKQLMDLSEQERRESTDLWQFTNLINQNYSREEKIQVAETLWSIVYKDGKVDQHEEYLMRKLTYLLDLDHQDMIAAKFSARDGIK